jgi:LysR family transcriptional regulator, glycine cleavage system transcriptional activator
MPNPRRLIPSLSLLSAFEAVCRTGSTLAAARDLDLSQGAVSRLIQNLEGQLGVTLFLREQRRLVPTDAALAYRRDVVKALDLITRGAMRLRSNASGGALSLSVLPAFGTRWLAPRLPAFLAAHPGITINLGTRVRPFDFEEEGFDAAIHFGAEDWPNAGFAKLFDEVLVAVCAPGYLARHPVDAAADMAGLSLLQLDSRPTAWRAWFGQHGVDAQGVQGMVFDQFAPMVEAAAHGLGVALLPQFLARAEIANGRLISLFDDGARGAGAYYLVWPKTGAWYPPLQAFRGWLAAECTAQG